MKQADNVVKIEGLLSENKLERISYSRNGVNTEAIGGSVIIKSKTHDAQGNVQDIEVPVYAFANKFKADGTPNKIYLGLEKVIENYKSIAAVGEENATKVSISNGQITENRYMTSDGKVVSFPRIRSNFINEVTRDLDPKASFNLTFVVHSIVDEATEDGDVYTVIHALIPQYNDRVDKIDLYCANVKVAESVKDYWKAGDTVSAQGRLDFHSETTKTVIPVDFGESENIQVRTTFVSKLVLTGGSQIPLSQEFAYNPEDIKKGLAARQAELEASQKKNAQRTTTAATGGPALAASPSDLGGFNW